MTENLALAIKSGKATYMVHREQLRATQRFIDRRTSPELMTLPYHVRHMILDHHTEAQTIRVFLRRGGTPILLPEAARAGNKQLRRECLLTALKKSTIEIHSGPGNAAFQAWLSQINFKGLETFLETGADAITSLRFPYFSRFPFKDPAVTTNNDVKLCQQSKNLRELTIDFHPEELFDRDASTRAHLPRTAENLREYYQLDGLLNMTNIEKMNFECYASEGEMRHLRTLMTWFKEQFKLQDRARKVIVQLNGMAV